MSITPGTILVHNGSKIIGVSPDSNEQALVLDSAAPGGIRWKTIDQSFKLGALYTIKSSNYKVVTEFAFIKAEHNTIRELSFIAYMQNGSTSYDIRLYDETNHVEMATANYNNNNSEIKTITKISNIPTSDAILEIHVKGSHSNKKIYIKDLTIKYN